MVNQAKQTARHCQSCQKFKPRATRYGHLPPMDIARLTPWNTVHIDLIGPYKKKVKQHQPGNTIKEVDLELTCMTFIDPSTGWFEIVQVPYFDMDNVNIGDQQYIDKTAARISKLFNNTWLSRYPRPNRQYMIMDRNSNEISYHCSKTLK